MRMKLWYKSQMKNGGIEKKIIFIGYNVRTKGYG